VKSYIKATVISYNVISPSVITAIVKRYGR